MSKQFKAGDTVLVINCADENFNRVFVVAGKRSHSYSGKPLIVVRPLQGGDEKLFHAWELQFRLSRQPYRDVGSHCTHMVCALAPSH